MLESSTPPEASPRDSSRIRVTALPKFVTKEKLRSIFSGYGEITDLVILRKPDGIPRMAFIGYRQPSEAHKCLEENNGMYLDSHKVQVDLAYPVAQGASTASAAAENPSAKSTPSRTKRKASSPDQRAEVTDEQFLQRIQAQTAQTDSEAAETHSDRIILKNLAFCTTKEAIQTLCEDEVGDVESVHIPLSLDKTRSRGIAFVRFRTHEKAAAAARKLQNFTFEGRLLVAEAAAPDPYAAGAKAQTSRPARKSSSVPTDRHSTLFLDSNTISKATSKELGISKESLLDPSKEGVATRTAISEAVLTSELDEALRAEGINASALDAEASGSKSTRIILVKNMHEVTAGVVAAVKAAFQKYGAIERVSAPKVYGVIVVAFQHECDALKAFRRLAFSTALGFPLLLEWAPSNIYSTSPVDPQSKADKSGEIQSSGSFATVFVKNLPRGCSAEKLKHHMLSHAASGFADNHIRNIRVVPNKGYAFVEFYAADKAAFCLSTMNNTLEMDDRLLSFEEVKDGATKAQGTSEISVPPGCDATKVTIKNVPFEATVKEIRSLFAAFSDVQSVRLPKKLHQYQSSKKNNHRGFAFVEFSSAEGAAEAMKMLKNVHLYGRRLCLEYASLSA